MLFIGKVFIIVALLAVCSRGLNISTAPSHGVTNMLTTPYLGVKNMSDYPADVLWRVAKGVRHVISLTRTAIHKSIDTCDIFVKDVNLWSPPVTLRPRAKPHVASAAQAVVQVLVKWDVELKALDIKIGAATHAENYLGSYFNLFRQYGRDLMIVKNLFYGVVDALRDLSEKVIGMDALDRFETNVTDTLLQNLIFWSTGPELDLLISRSEKFRPTRLSILDAIYMNELFIQFDTYLRAISQNITTIQKHILITQIKPTDVYAKSWDNLTITFSERFVEAAGPWKMLRLFE